ncbi:MAG: hypothetical protein IT210_04335 [Armatimonadetes bacterium]|nr:hypothetical protein [Armatimonadota bacterium]
METMQARDSLRAALESAEQLRDMHLRDAALFAVASEMAFIEPMEALKLVPRLGDPWGRAYVLRRIVRAISPATASPRNRDCRLISFSLPMGVS